MAQTTSLFFQDEVLPGVLTEIQQSYNYGYYTTEWGNTSTVIVMGTAFTGPTNKVMKIYSPEHAMYTFGGTYDAKSHKEASLVTGIQDAYDRGCRSIYACRISGKDLYKDFELAPDLGYKLRVSGAYPSNGNKNIYFRFVNSGDEIKLVYYKPADRATIREKMNGIVESSDSMIETVIDLSGTYGYTADTKVSELIDLFNTYQINNVLRLAIVDENGIDVTTTNPEVQNLPISAIFDGVYFIGRDSNTNASYTIVDSVMASDNIFWKDYNNVVTYKKIKLNTDINAPYPISGSYEDLRSVFVNITTVQKFDFISDLGSVDALFAKDSVDYDEVDISGFDLYKKLGSGYATTARITLKNPDAVNPTAKDYVVKETPADNGNHIVAISDGVYSVLQNVPADYRVLVHATATEDLNAKLPSKDEFLVTAPGSIQYFVTGNSQNAVMITPSVKEDDIVDASQYSFELKVVADDSIEEVGDIASGSTAKAIISVADAAAAPVDQLFLISADGTSYALAIKSGNEVKELDASYSMFNGEVYYDVVNNNLVKFAVADGSASTTVLDYAAYAADEFSAGKDFFMITYPDSVTCVAKYSEADGIKVLGTVQQVLSEDNSGMFTSHAIAYESTAYTVTLTESYLESATLESFVEDLNKSNLGKKFVFAYAPDYTSYKYEYLNSDSIALADQTTDASYYAILMYDTTKYIPYKTTDNLVRQLAQHCQYTTLKTESTHGIIGYGKISDASVTSVANAVSEACGRMFDLYAKKANGRNMLDKDNSPYDIGRNVSVVFGPSYYVTTPDAYRYVSTGAAGYAGMISKLPLEQSTTNQPIDVDAFLFELSNFQLTNLTNAGYVTFKDSYTKGYVVTDGITMAPNTSAFKRLSTTRIMNGVASIIRAACEPFIGKQNSLANRNSIKTAVSSALYKIMGTLINDFDFTVTSDLEQQKLGIIDIDYVIVPFYEIRQIRNRIRIVDSI